MSDRRKTQKNHIRAARNWLGQAEHSLDHENDVQGDLKLMLAKAELSRVEDSPHVFRLKRWGIRLLPVVVAVLLVGAGMAVFQEPSADPVVTQETSLPMPDSAAEPATASPAAVSTGETARPVPDEAPLHTEDRKPEMETSAPSAAEQPKAKPDMAVLPHGQVPDAETQKLMQSAGKALRQ